MAGIINTNVLTQIGIIVRDIQTSKRKFAEFFGVEVPPHHDAGDFEVTGTTVNGKPAPKSNCLMAFFSVGENVQLELIQPNGEKAHGRIFLMNMVKAYTTSHLVLRIWTKIYLHVRISA